MLQFLLYLLVIVHTYNNITYNFERTWEVISEINITKVLDWALYYDVNQYKANITVGTYVCQNKQTAVRQNLDMVRIICPRSKWNDNIWKISNRIL